MLAAALLPCSAAAQESLTLRDAIAMALERNRDLAVEREVAVQADAGVERARSAYDPVFRLDGRYRDQSLPVVSVLSGAPEGELAPTTRGVSASARYTRLLPAGGTITFGTSISRETSNSLLTLISPAWFTSAGVEFRQPLLQNRRIDPARRAIRVARLTRERSDASMRRLVADTTAAVEQAYWRLVAATREVDIRRSTVELAERQRDDVQARVEAGVTPEADLAQPVAEIERRKGELLAAIEARSRAEHALKALILDSAESPLWAVTLNPVDPPNMAPLPVDLQAALADARNLRPELDDLDRRLDLQEVEIEAARDRLKPQLDLVGSYTARGLAGGRHEDIIAIPGFPSGFPDDFDGALGTSLDLLARQRFPDATAGVTLSIPLGHRAARADIAAAESGRRQVVSLRERLLLQIALEVRNAVVAVQTAAQRIDAARASREAAAIQLQAEVDRFAAGATTSFFVLTRQNELAAAEVAEATALAAYRQALTELSRARGTLLRDRQVDWQTVR
ncbi:MAG TPA: TolC family protein [Vicinamibacterales bacterium]